MKRCPMGCSGDPAYRYQLFDDRYGYPGCFELMHCGACGHQFVRQDFSPNQLIDLYSNYYPRTQFDLAQYHPYREERGFFAWLDGSMSSAFRWVPARVRVLDIGCGFGESLGYHAARGCQVYGVEADHNISRVADKFGYRVHVGLFDPKWYEPNFFDYVTLDQVMEHVINPVEMLHDVVRVLKPGGKVVLTTPNANGWGAKVFGRKWINWHVPYHLQFFSKTSMQKLAEGAGLKVECARTVTASAWLYFQWLHLLTYPVPCEPSVFWTGLACGKQTELALGKKIFVRLLDFMRRVKVNHLLTRLFDIIGNGDSFVFVLSKP